MKWFKDLRDSLFRHHQLIQILLNIGILILIITSLTTAGYCEGETVYKITLKNGSSILVESYREVDGRIQFFRSGGFIEIDKNEVLQIKKVSAEMRETGEVHEEAPPQIQSISSPSRVSEDEIRKRLEEIQEKKQILKKEADTIIKEIEKLNQNIRKEGRVLAIRKKRELTKRKEGLERRVSDINKSIEDLQKEEEDLLNQLRSSW